MLAAAAAGLAAGTASAMSGYMWKNRPLVVFAPGGTHPGLAQQKAIIASLRPAFIDRNVVAVYVAGDSVSTDLGAGPGMGAAQLRSRFGVAPGAFRVLLVGKDGGVKLSSSSPVSAQTLFATIDAMPMRRDEMRKGR